MDCHQAKLKGFHLAKQQCLNKEDLSRKGSIDEPIRPLVDIINNNPYYYTTSTCSGRISLIEKPRENASIKKGGRFLLNNHEKLNLEDFLSVILSFSQRESSKTEEYTCLWLKFEPFILHVQCFDLERAHILLNSAVAGGCRNSGISLGKNDKFLVAVRSTSSMEVPIHCGPEFELNTRYINYLANECNRRLGENFVRLAKFQQDIECVLSR